MHKSEVIAQFYNNFSKFLLQPNDKIRIKLQFDFSMDTHKVNGFYAENLFYLQFGKFNSI